MGWYDTLTSPATAGMGSALAGLAQTQAPTNPLAGLAQQALAYQAGKDEEAKRAFDEAMRRGVLEVQQGQLGLSREQLANLKDQQAIQNALAQKKFDEDVRQFGIKSALEKMQIAQTGAYQQGMLKRYADELGLKKFISLQEPTGAEKLQVERDIAAQKSALAGAIKLYESNPAKYPNLGAAYMDVISAIIPKPSAASVK